MLYQNLKVAFRNLMKYKVQTLLSIASIAIGIVTLSLAFSVMTRFSLPSIMSQPFKNRAYKVIFNEIDGRTGVIINKNAFRALKADGGLRHAEKIATLNGSMVFPETEFHLIDSTKRKGYVSAGYVDPEYITYAGIRSAITGEKVKRLKKGEAIISEKYARDIFQNSNPVGAVQTLSNYTQSFPVTIVDIFEESSSYDPHKNYLDNRFLFCTDDNIEEYTGDYVQFSKVYMVLKEGSTEQELVAEINERLKPHNLTSGLSKVVNNQEIRRIVGIHILIYVLGSLLLLAAIIGFLRMQVQLFWMRRREITLRIVNGAKRLQVFRLLINEVVITLLLSVILSVILGNLLEDFLNKNLGFFIVSNLSLENLWINSLGIGVILLIICCATAYIVIRRINNTKIGLAKSIRRSSNHTFRNTMLGIQIVISIIFVSLTFILINGGNKLLQTFNIPENDSFYKGCLYLNLGVQNGVNDRYRFLEELEGLPDLDRIVSWSQRGYNIKEIQENDNANSLFRGTFIPFICLPDSTLLSFFDMDIEWLNREIDRNNCMLLGEDYYTKFNDLGILENGSLSFMVWGFGKPPSEICLPVAGIIKKIPYSDKTEINVTISPVYSPSYSKYDMNGSFVLVPKPAREKALERSVKELLDRLEPERIELYGNDIIKNYRSHLNSHPDTVEAVTTLGWILGIVSVVICAMSILSTLTLDTRSRRKEVAIRKVNGAKSIDIYRLFGRVYIVLLAFAIIVAIPVCVMFNGFVENYVKDHSTVEGFSPPWPIILAISIVTILILAIVGWQTRKTLHMDPAKIIAKE